MSGTSADGIDAAVVEIPEGERPRLLAHFFLAYPAEVRDLVLSVCRAGKAGVDVVSNVNFVLGELFAEAALGAIKQAGITAREVDAIGSHGQTVWHQPEDAEIAGRKVRSTLQIGEAAVIAERTGVPVISNFRAADMAAGGQGAPLAAFADFVLFRHEAFSRTVQNIGGIANVTFLKAGCRMEDVVAFDTGPGNMLIDGAVRRFTGATKSYDCDGQLAAAGTVSARLLDRLMRHPFLSAAPPKSTGREAFGEQFLEEILGWPEARKLEDCDVIATLTAFTAASIEDAYRRFLPSLPDQVILGGGGSRNVTLRRMLEKKLSPISVLVHEDFGIPSTAKEAMAFAILAAETLRGRPSNVPSATGARHRVVLGSIYRSR